MVIPYLTSWQVEPADVVISTRLLFYLLFLQRFKYVCLRVNFSSFSLHSKPVVSDSGVTSITVFLVCILSLPVTFTSWPSSEESVLNNFRGAPLFDEWRKGCLSLTCHAVCSFQCSADDAAAAQFYYLVALLWWWWWWWWCCSLAQLPADMMWSSEFGVKCRRWLMRLGKKSQMY